MQKYFKLFSKYPLTNPMDYYIIRLSNKTSDSKEETYMNKWCIVEEKGNKAEVTTYISEERAIQDAQECWDKYTDKEGVDHFYIALISVNFGINTCETYLDDIELKNIGKIIEVSKKWK